MKRSRMRNLAVQIDWWIIRFLTLFGMTAGLMSFRTKRNGVRNLVFNRISFLVKFLTPFEMII